VPLPESKTTLLFEAWLYRSLNAAWQVIGILLLTVIVFYLD
jgi:hypothetical protein